MAGHDMSALLRSLWVFMTLLGKSRYAVAVTAPAPRFSFSVPFAFETAVGIKGTEFAARDSFRLALIAVE